MKLLLTLFLLVGLSSCGLQRQTNNLKNKQQESDARLRALEASLAEAQYQLTLLTLSSATQTSDIQQLQASVAALTVQLATLQGYTNIVAIKDPCGPQGAFNEILLQLSTGQYIASFSDNIEGRNTRFAVLSNGNYTTTDGTNCHFTVNNALITNEHN